MSLAQRLNLNWVGRRVLPYENARVVAPPGVPVTQDRPNIVVATPKRSGTHVLIDILLNNLPAYRRRPLYVEPRQVLAQPVSRSAINLPD